MKLVLRAEPPLASKFEHYTISSSDDGLDRPFVARDDTNSPERPIRLGFRMTAKGIGERKLGREEWLDDHTVSHDIWFSSAELNCTVDEAMVLLRGLQEAIGGKP